MIMKYQFRFELALLKLIDIVHVVPLASIAAEPQQLQAQKKKHLTSL